MFTLRINVEDTDALDGLTPLPANAKQLVKSTGQPLQIYELTLPVGQFFGLFNPGELGLLGKSGSYVMRHCTVYSQGLANGGFYHFDGSVVQVVSPPRPGGGTSRRTILDLAVDGVGSGVIPEGSGVPIPVGHQLRFDTIADGIAPGPHIIQMTFGRADIPKRISAGILNPPPVAFCDPPSITSYTPPPGLVIIAGSGAGPFPVNISGTNFLADDVVTLQRIGPPDGLNLPFSGLVITDPTDIDFDIDDVPAGPNFVGLYELCVTRAADPNCQTCVAYVTVQPGV